MAPRAKKSTAVTEELKQQASATNDAQPQQKGNQAAQPTLATVIRSVDRTIKDMGKLKNALIAAESPYLPNAQQLMDIYEQIRLDGFLSGIVDKRINMVLNKRLKYVVGEQDKEEFAKLIDSAEFRGMMRERMLQVFWGVRGMEFIPGSTFEWNSINPKHIKRKWRKIVWEQAGTEGINYDDYWNILVVGDNKDLGLFLICAYYVLLKRGVIGDWAEYVEMYGLPVTVLKYDGYNEQDKAEGNKILQNAGAATKLLLPKNLEYQIIEPKTTSANGTLQNDFIQRCNDEIAIAVLGVTETSGSSESSGYAQASVHSAQQLETHKADMQLMLQFLNSPEFTTVLKSYGYPVSENGRFEFDKEVDIKYLAEKAKIDIPLIRDLKLPVSKKYLYETYGIEEPKDGDELLEVLEEMAQDDEDEPDEDKPTPAPKKTGKGTKKNPNKLRLHNLSDSKTTEFWNAFKALFQ